jgi:TPR repeat
MPASTSNTRFGSSLLIALAFLATSPFVKSEERAPWVGERLDGKECKGSHIPFGPFDYLRREQLPAELEVVERAHFFPEVETLESPFSIDDISYTVMAWPNHHRALHSSMKFRMMTLDWPENSKTAPAECQLQRAINFSPRDPVPYMMYGLMLHKAKQYDKALLSYRAAIGLRPDDVLTQYNMGLTLVELKQYQEALKMAKAAYAAGMPLPGLKNKLIAAGQWPGIPSAAAPQQATPDVKLTSAEKPAQDQTTDSKAAEKEPTENQPAKNQSAESQVTSGQPVKDNTGKETVQKPAP